MAQRRGHNEGSIYQRASDHRWTAAVTLANGSRRVYYGSSKREVRDKLMSAQALNREGRLVASGNQTVEVYLNTWLRHKASSIRPHTAVAYQLSIDRVAPYIGRIRLSALQPTHLQECYSMLLRKGPRGKPLSGRSVEQTHGVIRTALRYAVKVDLMPRNPADLVDPPHGEHREIRTLSIDEAYSLFESTKSDPLHALWVILATTGLRFGEALGLMWSDVDVPNARAVVSRSLQRQQGRGLVLVGTKTAASRRTIELTRIAVEALKTHRTHQLETKLLLGSDWRDSGMVFCSAVGTPVDPANARHQFYRALQVSGVAAIRVHDLRHTAATIMLQQGIHPRVVQEMLGHTNISMTLGIYSHVIPTMHRDAVDKLDELYSRRHLVAGHGHR
jgi:site-specific recombinase XerD